MKRGLDRLQELLDELPADDQTCRDAWCGRWERNNGEYERHAAGHEGLATGGVQVEPLICANCGKTMAEHDALAHCWGPESKTFTCSAGSTEWRCEECHAPWEPINGQCRRCGNRTRLPVLIDGTMDGINESKS